MVMYHHQGYKPAKDEQKLKAIITLGEETYQINVT